MRRLPYLPWPLIIPLLALCGMVALFRVFYPHRETPRKTEEEGPQSALPEGQRKLIHAVEINNQRITAQLLREGMDLNIRRLQRVPQDGKPTSDPTMRYVGDPLLKIAVSARDESIARLLLEKGADVNLPGRFGYTPLMAAADVVEPNLVKLLLKKGAAPNAVSADHQESALHLVLMGRLSRQFVVNHNPRYFSGLSPEGKRRYMRGIERLNEEHRLLQGKQIAIIKLLLEAGADPGQKDSSGQTPLDYARKRNDTEIVSLLTSPKFARNATLTKSAGR